MKKSISKKINYLIIVSMITLSFFVIVVNFLLLYRSASNNSEIMMRETCESLALELNGQFGLVEQSIQNLYDISEGIRPDIESLKNPDVADNFVKQFEDVAITIADNTKGALALYYRMNPELTLSGTTGFFYVRSSDTNKFEATDITDLYEYDVNDMEHVGWYYVPVWAGEPVWMDPYYNANIDVEMISYVVPIFDGSDLIGVVGIDVDFNSIKETVEDIDVYENCGAVLCSMTNNQIYYNKCDDFGDTLHDEMYRMLQGSNVAEKIIYHNHDGKKYGIYYETIENRMKLMVYADSKDIFEQGQISLIISLIGFIIIFILTLLVSFKISRRIVKPIGDITEASKKYAEGDWNIKVECDTEDEIQVLAENISIMADKTREYIDYIHDMAKKDVLTGLRNKTDYALYVEKVKESYNAEKKKYAVAVFDVNNLKKVNDTYGHEKGDELIVAASRLICKYFSHSPVFRIGGDEFVSIIDGADFEDREEKIADFYKYMELSKKSSDIMDVCVACGMATVGDDLEVYEEVFDLADQIMYENKKKLKDGASPR